MYKKFFKRLIDILISTIFLVVFSPIILITAILVKMKLGSPVIFQQKRPGKHGKVFVMYKFRTMTNTLDEYGELLSDEKRLTKFGKFLRSSSLDELPELINIIKGDMSVVGPRPLLVEYLPYYNDVQKRRHEVRPGLTGLAQISGRNLTTWDERLNLDVQYVDNVGFIQDLRIFFITIGKVLKREGIFAENSATMESFVEYCEKQQE